MGRLIAIFRCLTCGHVWQQTPGSATCPECLKLDPDIGPWNPYTGRGGKDHYCQWMNYDELARERGWRQ